MSIVLPPKQISQGRNSESTLFFLVVSNFSRETLGISNRAQAHPFPNYCDLSKKCDYHFGNPRHNLEDCWTLKNKIQDLIDQDILQFLKELAPNITKNRLSPHGENNTNMIVEEQLEIIMLSRFVSWKKFE